MTRARTLFASAAPHKVAVFLFNASAFPFSRHEWEELEPLLKEALHYHERLAQVQWELHGNTEQLLLTTRENLRVQATNFYNAPVNHAALGRLLALLSDAS